MYGTYESNGGSRVETQGGVAKAKYDPMYARSGGFRGLFHFLKLVICRGTGVLEVVGNSVIF